MVSSSGWNSEHDSNISLDNYSDQPHVNHLASTSKLVTDSAAVGTHGKGFGRGLRPHGPGTHFEGEKTESEATRSGSHWRIHWRSPTLMLSLFVFGILSSVAHHVYYQSLHGTDVASTTTQQWAIRIGTGLAFLAKASLAASVGVGFTQRLWVTLRNKPISLQAIDDLFSLTMDPTSFFSLEVLGKAKLLCLLAASMWCIPLVATITPATLSVHLETMQNTTNVLVPYLDYDSAWSWAKYEGAGFIRGGSIPVHRVVAATATAGDIVQVASQYPNSSYELEFFGPSLRCFNLSHKATRKDDQQNITALEDMFNKTVEVETGFSGPLIWNGETTTNMTDTIFVNIGGASGHNISCNLWNTSYTVLFNSTTTERSTRITKLNTTEAVHVRQGDVPTAYTKPQIAYSSYSSAILSILDVQIGISAMGTNNNQEAFILKTSLAACPEIVAGLRQTSGSIDESQAYMCRNGTVLRAIEDLSHNFTLSLLASELLAGNTTVGVDVYTPVNKYFYNWRNLVAAYGTGILVALAGVCVGAASYFANGFSASMSFSSVLFTTRNADLDRLVEGRCLPAQPLGKQLGKIKLRYGLLKPSDESAGVYEHAAFGFSNTVRGLKKGAPCA